MLANKILTPLQKFTKIESFSGILLIIATVIALIWANSPFSDSYVALWNSKVGFSFTGFELYKPLLLWINDLLMAIFFFVIGLEIKREFLIGELNTTKKLVFPLVGALGGMILPVVLFVVINQNPETAKGWGIAMATDIAFALAILKLLGDKVPMALKIFLTAFAIIDDMAAVLVIAIFYSGNIEIVMLVIAVGLLAILYFLAYKGVYSKFVLIVVGAMVWFLFLKSGLHPTIAGVLLAFSVPLRQNINTTTFVTSLNAILNNIKNNPEKSIPVLSKIQIQEIDNLEDWTTKYQSPLQHLEHRLHNWVAYFIIPVFALANAGVVLNTEISLDQALIITIIICLVVGKSIGITSLIFLAKRLRWIAIPKAINMRHIVGVSFIAGVGFTMSIFIASLAFASRPEYLDSAKIGILIGSLTSALIGYFILASNSNKKPHPIK
ncbi:NhaA family Na+:H+ antiporter [Gelidibacter algens]|uniref:Na(+)/H(+) antiporter NhaA n=1 Tax=Gelidibacter algens TaxID=49280 RepID=A0A1A7QU55_9FLAO|nr:Na+/H+ antiporter NhaA [Gelidibacter algens]OBX22744.1 Na+/H+ antiporter NhaA [Gelidibacter algens]RAJ20783.1 NhaA family Na+:H+ antiporter [Gelidibacter algens]